MMNKLWNSATATVIKAQRVECVIRVEEKQDPIPEALETQGLRSRKPGPMMDGSKRIFAQKHGKPYLQRKDGKEMRKS